MVFYQFDYLTKENLCLYQVPDRIEVKYNGRPLEKLSLGERATAVLMLVLSQSNKPVIIDQPEEDLDSQTIYRGLIKKIVELKDNRQLIFATHNPNIPVLGDCEQVLVCQVEDDNIRAKTGSIDVKNVQESIIDIMEGGRKALEKREEIYNGWIL